MRNHVLRPLWVVIGAVALLLLARYLMVPADFGVNGENFTYGYHRQGNIEEWRVVPVKYQGRQYCAECHEDKSEQAGMSSHGIIQCENCHGPALDHPENPERLTIDTSRELCLRCHADLGYPGGARADIRAISPSRHNPGMDCSACHNPHNPSLEDMK